MSSPAAAARAIERPLAASTLAPDLLLGSATLTVAGAHPQAVYLLQGREVVSIVSPGAQVLPDALRAASTDDLRGMEVRQGQSVTVEGGRLHTPGGVFAVRRRWSPRRLQDGPPVTAPPDLVASVSARGRHVETRLLEHRAATVTMLLGDPADHRLDPAIADLVGRGPGLTPAGDDFLAGLLLGLRCLGRTAERRRLARLLGPLTDRTTALSARLLILAADGYAVPAVLDLLVQIRRSAAEPAAAVPTPLLERVAAIGHSTGPALLTGIGAALACASPPGDHPSAHHHAPSFEGAHA